MTPAQIESKKGEIMKLDSALQYLARFELLPEPSDAAKELRAVIAAQEWEKKKK
jgi:hypothetical protein